MNCLELACGFSEKDSKVENEIRGQKNIFDSLIKRTQNCMNNINDDDDPIECEVAYLSEDNKFTWHTHPAGTREPSDVDIKTTNNLKKDFLCIGLVPTGETVCWHKDDNFKEEVFSF